MIATSAPDAMYCLTVLAFILSSFATSSTVNNRIVNDEEEFADSYFIRKEGRYKPWEYSVRSVTHKQQGISVSQRLSPASCNVAISSSNPMVRTTDMIS